MRQLDCYIALPAPNIYYILYTKAVFSHDLNNVENQVQCCVHRCSTFVCVGHGLTDKKIPFGLGQGWNLGRVPSIMMTDNALISILNYVDVSATKEWKVTHRKAEKSTEQLCTLGLHSV